MLSWLHPSIIPCAASTLRFLVVRHGTWFEKSRQIMLTIVTTRRKTGIRTRMSISRPFQIPRPGVPNYLAPETNQAIYTSRTQFDCQLVSCNATVKEKLLWKFRDLVIKKINVGAAPHPQSNKCRIRNYRTKV
jgi:hypothetical protein